MKTQKIDGFEVTGIVVRTTNENEMNPSTSKIANLWETFYINASPKLSEEAKIYGIYTNYESDCTGAFDVIASSDMLQLEELTDSVKVKVQSGQYLVFTAKGEMPQVVIELWGKIWNYFNSKNCPHKRACTTDFEYYKSENEIEIYIALR
ncbi:MAG: hypothetical protein CSB48_12065 [Proteobacteria bacterium]|nr:MAG: hypothetical protein CSB48_12065 [Pseudomonadota bacterium]